MQFTLINGQGVQNWGVRGLSRPETPPHFLGIYWEKISKISKFFGIFFFLFRRAPIKNLLPHTLLMLRNNIFFASFLSQKPINETIWNCRNFTRKIKECVVLEEEEKTCKFFKQEICKPIHLPGKCAKVTHKKNCTTKCPPKHPLYDPEVHKECSYKNGTTISIISEIFETATEPINLRTNKLDLRQEDPRIGMY